MNTLLLTLVENVPDKTLQKRPLPTRMRRVNGTMLHRMIVREYAVTLARRESSRYPPPTTHVLVPLQRHWGLGNSRQSK